MLQGANLRGVIFVSSIAALGMTWRGDAPVSKPQPRAAQVRPVKLGERGVTKQRGVASWYGGALHGRYTASGERFNMLQLTAAHRELPFGSRVRVTNLRTGLAVVVRINDRGPMVANCAIDLSFAAAQRLHMLHSGVDQVTLELLDGPLAAPPLPAAPLPPELDARLATPTRIQ